MDESGLPTTVVICCPLPTSLTAAEAEACLGAGSRTAVQITWVVPVERLSMVSKRLGAAGARSTLAIAIPSEVVGSRQSLRHLLSQARSEVAGLDAAVIGGPLSAESRRQLVESGIRIVCRDRVDDARGGTRRPAPPGWPCRSLLWGLWEVARVREDRPTVLRRFLPWLPLARPEQGGLAVLDAGGQGVSAEAIRRHMERWQSWGQRRHATGTMFATLSDLPALIAGAARAPVGGSVLRAA